MTLGASGIGTATGAAAQATSWAAAGDFSAASNPNGAWSYGWSASRGSAFNLDTVATTVSGVNVWNYSATQVEPDVFFNGTSNTINPSGTNPIPAGTLAFHPGPIGQNAIVRWTAPSTGAYAIAATFTGRDFVGPTTTDVAVLSNEGLLWSGEVTGYLAMQSYAASRLDLIAGDTLDFTVGFGTDATYSYDSTGLIADISQFDTTPPVASITTGAPAKLDSAGSSNPDSNFRFDSTLGTSGGYIFNLDTSGLAAGTYALSFTVSGDLTLHSAQFAVS